MNKDITNYAVLCICQLFKYGFFSTDQIWMSMHYQIPKSSIEFICSNFNTNMRYFWKTNLRKEEIEKRE